MIFKILPYHPGSRSAFNLSKALGCLRLKPGSRFAPKKYHKIINWGNSSRPMFVTESDCLNDPHLVSRMSNKTEFFKFMEDFEDVNLVPWTITESLAKEWIEEGSTVVARTLTRGSGGRGIKILEKGVDFCYAPLYTKYVKKAEEYRIHVAFGEIIDVQKKIRDPNSEVEPLDWKIRNHSNGFIFVRNTADPDEQVLEQALNVMKRSKLDFGAVDIIWNDYQKKAYVLEINTAPGLEGETVNKYKEAFETYAMSNLRQTS